MLMFKTKFELGVARLCHVERLQGLMDAKTDKLLRLSAELEAPEGSPSSPNFVDEKRGFGFRQIFYRWIQPPELHRITIRSRLGGSGRCSIAEA